MLSQMPQTIGRLAFYNCNIPFPCLWTCRRHSIVRRLCCAESIIVLLEPVKTRTYWEFTCTFLLTPRIYNGYQFSIYFPKMLKDHLKSHGGRYNVFLVLSKLYIDPNEDYICLRPPGSFGYRWCDLLAFEFSLMDCFTLWEDLAP